MSKNRDGKPTEFQTAKIKALGGSLKGIKTYRDAENYIKRLNSAAKKADGTNKTNKTDKTGKPEKKPVSKPAKPEVKLPVKATKKAIKEAIAKNPSVKGLSVEIVPLKLSDADAKKLLDGVAKELGMTVVSISQICKMADLLTFFMTEARKIFG